MQVLSFVNQKGGCGKTTTAVNLAGALAVRGAQVLLVDLDPQAHATMGLGCSLDGSVDGSLGREPSAAEVLLEEVSIGDAIQRGPGGIDLLPSAPHLSEFEEVSERLIQPERRLARALQEVAGRYDWVVVDCPPRADGVLCANALNACTTALLVVETGAFALQGAIKAQRVLAEVAQNQGRSFDVRVVGTMFDRRTKFARELLVALHARFGAAMFDTVIRTSVRLREAPALGLPVQELDPACRAASDFASLAEEVVGMAQSQTASPAATQTGAQSGPPIAVPPPSAAETEVSAGVPASKL